MASPLGHLAAGAAVWYAMRARWLALRESQRRAFVMTFVFAAVLSLLPDGDAALGILFGDFGRYHNNWTHSLLWVPIVGVVTGFVLHGLTGARWRDGFWLAVFCVSLHIAMDYTTVGRGVMLLWPLSAARFQSPLLLFYGLHWSQPWSSPAHLITLGNEAAWIALGLATILWFRRRREMAAV